MVSRVCASLSQQSSTLLLDEDDTTSLLSCRTPAVVSFGSFTCEHPASVGESDVGPIRTQLVAKYNPQHGTWLRFGGRAQDGR